MRRHVLLPRRGVLMVNTDVHGNAEDFARLEAIFREERARDPETFWVILGDVVHAPDDTARAQRPELYDYDDGSMEIVARIDALTREHPDHVLFVLGNHDHGHVGGPHPGKFHFDEVEALEAKLTASERELLRSVFERALLAVVAPCGVLLCHGSPDEALTDVRMLDGVPLAIEEMPDEARRAIRSMLVSYGQPDEVARAMLRAVSRAGGWDLRVVVHGHDRDLDGFFREGETQVCPVIFGAPRANKRWVRLDLAARYDDAAALRDGVEIRRLYD